MVTLCHYAIIVLLPHFLSVSSADENDLLVTVKNGKVQGTLLPVLNGNVRAFLGIPYAKPPVGKLRFRNPEPIDSWEGVKNANSFSNTCFQLADMTFPGFRGAEMWNPNTPVNEDCLYLNVWTPQAQASSPLPVMIWIYGGGFTTGTSSLELYDGRYLTKSEDVIVVSMNYRVGVLGFLSLPNNTNVHGNAGLMDQRLAIQWVVDNIAAFGGDPSQITLFGESAGSVCVGFHVLSPGSNVLFKRAVMQSGAPTAHWTTVSLSEAWNRYQKAGGKPFLYYFQHRSSRNPWPEWMGVMHGYEIEFVFGLPLNPSLGYTEEEVNMSKRFMKYWATFARTGNPGIDGQPWPMFTSEKREYVTLDTQNPEYKSNLRADDCQFWNSLIPQIRKMAADLQTCSGAIEPILSFTSFLLMSLYYLLIH